MRKLNKIITSIVLAIVAMTGIQVQAASTMTITKKTYIYTDSRSEAKFYTNKGYAYCITPQSTGPSQGTTLRYKSKLTSGGVLYLLEKAGTSDSEYLATQLAIWQYDGNYMPDFYLNHSNYSVVKKAKTLAAQAESHSNYQSKEPTVNLSGNGSTLVETSDGKYYKSGLITLSASNAKSLNFKIESAPSGTKLVDENNNVISSISSSTKFYVLVPTESITASSTVSLSATATGTVSRVERYTTGDSRWQELVVLVKENKTVSANATLKVSYIKRYCEYSNGKYYGKNGSVVTKEEYSIQCEKHTCEKVGNSYFGKNGTIVTAEQYDLECNSHTCEKVGDKYFGKNGKVVTAEQYDLECNSHKCEKVGDKYFGKNGTEVDEKTYNKECFSHTCEIVDGTYYGKDGNEIDYSEYTIQCEKHTCEFVNGKYFGIQGTEVTQDQYISECIHTCEVYNNQYYGKNGKVVTFEQYKSECEAQVVPVPDTGSMSDLISIIIGSSILGAVAGVLAHNSKRKHA